MELEEEMKPCGNCKREIPCSNLTMHELHCERNISSCPTCKEPVPRSLMQEHQDKYHTLGPCKQCGESVRGSDLEDHIRDSCANTIKSCRFCELDLPRRAQPAHESYCGARTEQCADCGEYVMIKYRQLHLDSNHGFLRLDDDPAPALAAAKPSSTKSTQNSVLKNAMKQKNTDAGIASSTSDNNNGPSASGAIARPKNASKTKKRPAPAPPAREPAPLKLRDLPYYSAMSRAQAEEMSRQEQNAYNMAMGLPPVLNPAQKLEKLRKMDAFANRETEPTDYRERLRGQVWMTPHVPAGQLLGSSRMSPDLANAIGPAVPADQVQGSSKMPHDSTQNQERKKDRPKSSKGKSVKKTNHTANGYHPWADDEEEIERRRREFQNLKPMTPQEFANRFNEMQISPGAPPVMDDDAGEPRNDRFNDIKSSLRELRRGLNEVTAPYNANVLNGNVPDNEPAPDMIPCEFCSKLIEPDNLVIHQTGCRPDLAQYKPPSARPPAARPCSPTRPHSPVRPNVLPLFEEPVIPCEFCFEALPFYLITEHQERCGREANLLYPD